MNGLSVIFALIFLAVALAVYGVYFDFVFNRGANKAVNRRLELSKTFANASVVPETLRQERGVSNSSNPMLRRLSDWRTQTGTRLERRSLALGYLGVGLALFLILSALLEFGFASLGLALVTSAALVVLGLIRRRSRRILAFGEQLPDAIDIIVRAIRVGLPFSNAIDLVAREMPDPIGTEFGMLADEIAFGLNARSALENLYRRVGQEDLLFLTVAVSIQSQTGGNLGEILSRLSRLMRSRAKMRLKVRALSAEGRASGMALSAFPFVLLLVINIVSPTYYGAIRSHPLVEPAIYIGLFLLIVGNVIMYRMVHFKY